ncbi:MAG: alpha/beta hydrolase [Proteobacteria bacterium]|nr:alpha/beta hydrolase [Pseudomonadota bacterium]
MDIDRLKRIIREKVIPLDTPISLAERRAEMERVSFRVAEDITVEQVTAGERPAEWLRAPGINPKRAVMYLHGGGYVMGSLNTHRSLGGEISRAANAAVLMVDYRLAPEAPFPAAVDDACAAFEWLLGQGFHAENLAISGDSAGGGLTAACLVALRDKQVALPRAAVCISPWSDLSCSNSSYQTRADADPMVTFNGLHEMVQQYVQGQDVEHPHISPNFADLSSLPPLLIHVGNDEVLLDDSVELHDKAQAAGVDSTLEIWDDMIHVWHAFHPMLAEGKQGIVRIGEFLQSHWDTN